MIVIYGSRLGGAVDAFEGQYGATRFAHIYWVPLFPIGSIWVTGDGEDGHFGHAMRWRLKSIAAGYLRVWGVIAAVAGFATGGIGYVWGSAALAATLATFRWWRVRGVHNLREREFLTATAGTACDPAHMPTAVAHELRGHVEETWAEHFGARSPNDVARFGAKDADEAAVAYTLLRLVGRTSPPSAAAELNVAAARIIDSVRDTSALEDGNPYRTQHDVSRAIDD